MISRFWLAGDETVHPWLPRALLGSVPVVLTAAVAGRRHGEAPVLCGLAVDPWKTDKRSTVRSVRRSGYRLK